MVSLCARPSSTGPTAAARLAAPMAAAMRAPRPRCGQPTCPYPVHHLAVSRSPRTTSCIRSVPMLIAVWSSTGAPSPLHRRSAILDLRRRDTRHFAQLVPSPLVRAAAHATDARRRRGLHPRRQRAALGSRRRLGVGNLLRLHHRATAVASLAPKLPWQQQLELQPMRAGGPAAAQRPVHVRCVSSQLRRAPLLGRLVLRQRELRQRLQHHLRWLPRLVLMGVRFDGVRFDGACGRDEVPRDRSPMTSHATGRREHARE